MFLLRSIIQKAQTVCKPGSVPRLSGDGHSSGTFVAERLARPTRAAARKARPAARIALPAAPTWSCSRWGLPCRRRCRQRGALLPHHFTLAARRFVISEPVGARRCVSVALSLGSPPPGVTRHRASVAPGLSSRDPRTDPGRERPSDRLAWAHVGNAAPNSKISATLFARQTARSNLGARRSG